MPNNPPTKPRLPGGQPGNTNALKFGLYSRRVKSHIDQSYLATITPDQLLQDLETIKGAYLTLFNFVNPDSTLRRIVKVSRYIQALNIKFDQILRHIYEYQEKNDPMLFDYIKLLNQIAKSGMYLNLAANKPPESPASPAPAPDDDDNHAAADNA